MSDKPKIGFYWCASCGGCEESVVDLAEEILNVVEQVEIVFWPVAMDFKKQDIEAMADGEIVATMINGAIRTSEQEEMAHLLRKKSQVIIAYGSCAHTGGIPALANQFEREHILKYVYEDCPSVVNEEKVRPLTEYNDGERVVTLPEFRNVVRSLDQVIDVDYYLPGCAPNPELLKQAVGVLLSGNLPPKGTVLSPDVALCDACPRIDSKPADLSIEQFKRAHWTEMDSETCFLAQGIPCMGPATRSGCGERCIQGDMPCTGCFGPTSRIKDQGAKLASCFASSAAGTTEKDIEEILSGIPDPIGTFYRYALASSLLRRKADLSDSK